MDQSFRLHFSYIKAQKMISNDYNSSFNENNPGQIRMSNKIFYSFFKFFCGICICIDIIKTHFNSHQFLRLLNAKQPCYGSRINLFPLRK